VLVNARRHDRGWQLETTTGLGDNWDNSEERHYHVVSVDEAVSSFERQLEARFKASWLI
jgi:hypothetical protein